MSCKGCDKETDKPTGIAYYRIGNKEIGWGNIGLMGCREHLKLAIDRLNKMIK